MFYSRFPKQYLYLFLVLISVLILGLLGIFRPVRRLVEKTTIIPIQQKIYDWQRFLKKDLNSCSLLEERTVTELKSKIAALEEENRQQKRLLSSPLPKNWQFLTVNIIGVEKETVSISAGKSQKVEINMPAVSGEIYLGKINSVSESISTIKLNSFVDEKTVVSIISSKDQTIVGRGLLIGTGEGGMRVEQINLTENVNKDDLVQTDILGKNLLIGVVAEVNAKKGEMFKTAIVSRQFNPEELGTVFLVTGKL